MNATLSRYGTILLFGLTSGCAWSPGQPWATVDAELEALFAPSSSRLTPEGRLKTNNDYAIELEHIEVGLASLVVAQSAGEGDLSFDPADPPPGYSLCHNGHCHADDGRLVSYAEIEAELSGDAAPSGYSVTLNMSQTVSLSSSPTPVTPGTCSSQCQLEYGALEQLALYLTSFLFEGRVFDTTGKGRLPAEGVAVSGALTLQSVATAELEGAADKSSPPLIHLDVRFPLTERVFDSIDWSLAGSGGPLVIQDGSTIADQIGSNLGEFSTLEVNMQRTE